MNTPTFFDILPSSQTGDVYATNFVFKSTVSSNYTKFVWDFGDGLTGYTSITSSHIYNFPGTYVVSMSAWNSEGSMLVDSGTIVVDYAYRDGIIITDTPSANGTAGVMPTEAFVLSVTSANIFSPIGLVLHASNSRSVPHTTVSDEKWNFLIPRWMFINAETNKAIDDVLEINTRPIHKNGTVVAVSGTASFYYYDDLPTTKTLENSCPLLITATLSTQAFSNFPEFVHYPYYSYSNSEVVAIVTAWQVNETLPTNLKVTENFISDVYPIKWSNVPVPIMITCHYNDSAFPNLQSSANFNSKVLSYPKTNLLGSNYAIKVALSSASGLIPENYYTVEVDGTSYSPSAAPLYFKNNDNDGNFTGGYVFTTFTPLSPISDTVVVAVSTVASNGLTNFPFGYPLIQHSYVSHPQAGVINKLGVTTFSKETCKDAAYYESINVSSAGDRTPFNSPILTVNNLTNYTLAGAAGVYGMAINPLKSRLYATDADQDTVLEYDISFPTPVLVNTHQLSFYTGSTYNVPSYVSVDGNGDIWISLFGNSSIVKFDSDFNLLASPVPMVTVPLTSTSFGSLLVEPPTVEADKNNDAWACYAHSLSSMLVKYDSAGTELFKATSLSVSSVPVALAIDGNNNVWVACYNTNKIECYSGINGSLLYSSAHMLIHPSYIAFDNNEDLWIAHGVNKISKLNPASDILVTYEIDQLTDTIHTISNTYTTTELNEALMTDEIWGGLSVDVFGSVWAIDRNDNAVYVFDSNNPLSTLTTVYLTPSPATHTVVLNGVVSSASSTVPIRSAQAAGDWNANKWYQKYTGGGSTVASLAISGQSTPFNILDLETGVPRIVKKNEEFNTAGYYKSLALPENLYNNNEFFDVFLKAIVGDGDPTQESIGRIIYEKIANFAQSHGDFETADIEQLMAYAKELKVKNGTFGSEYPREVKRLLDLFSINKHFLRGRVKYDTNLQNQIGELLTLNSLLTAGKSVFMKDKIYSTYQSVYVSPLDSGAEIYPLSSIEIDGAREPVFDNYFFFEVKDNMLGYTNNIINWESAFNTLEYELSSNEQWYGDNGLVELTFNNLLTKTFFS